MSQTSRTFRIFVSSTFSDLVAERNALQERVFPRLRDAVPTARLPLPGHRPALGGEQ